MNQQNTSFPERALIDVLIVGAGPTGLTAALELARRGIAFRLIEKSPQRSPHSKAMALHARTLEILELLSPRLADAFVRVGYTSPGASLSTGSTTIATDFSHLDTTYPYILHSPPPLHGRVWREQGEISPPKHLCHFHLSSVLVARVFLG